MAIKTYKPTSPALREKNDRSVPDHLTKKEAGKEPDRADKAHRRP